MNHLIIMSDPAISSNRHKTLNNKNTNVGNIEKYIITAKTEDSSELEVAEESTCDDSSSE